MSRIGKLPVDLPAGVTVTVGPGNVVSVKGPLGQLSQKVDSDITVTVEGNQLTVTRPTDQPRHRSMHGLYRALIHNMVVGVSKGYEIKQELVGVGFKAEAKGQILELSLGYSHDIFVQLPPEIKVEAVTEKKGNPIVTLKMRIRKIVSGTAEKPRMSVFRSNKQISVQLIDDLRGVTLAAASSLDKEVAEKAAGLTKSQIAALVGKLAAERCAQKGIAEVAFDRNGYLYHGRVKMLADAAREGGLKF